MKHETLCQLAMVIVFIISLHLLNITKWELVRQPLDKRNPTHTPLNLHFPLQPVSIMLTIQYFTPVHEFKLLSLIGHLVTVDKDKTLSIC